jgi:chemotaxis protein methyltransferase CheR
MRRLENPAAVERFRSLIQSRLGLQFEDAKLTFLGEVIQLRLDDTGFSVDQYLYALEDATSQNELAPLAKELTVPETYFFRNNDQFRAFKDLVLPRRIAAQSASRTLNILSAGCASGEEAYSIAMTTLGSLPDPSWTLSLRAMDINPTALKKARRGRYSSWAFRETPPELQQKWFQKDGNEFILNERVRNAVTFVEQNLFAEESDMWRSQSYDVIFCRNVMMYFSPEHARKLVGRIAGALAPKGYLFLGHAETLRGLSDDFHLRHTHDAFYYERKDAREEAEMPSIFTPASASQENPEPPASMDWVESIQRANDRVQALSTDRKHETSAVNGKAQRPRLGPDMTPVFAMLHGDRFADALTYVRELPQEAGDDPDVLLMEAMLLAHASKTAEAEQVCQRLLRLDELNASAHHILALCREAAGDLEGALEHDRIAAYLDPAFAMPHLHMGLLARRAGNRDLGRRELAHALTLLKHEDSARLMLFGGGFNRQSMIELCASALKDCGGTPYE